MLEHRDARHDIELPGEKRLLLDLGRDNPAGKTRARAAENLDTDVNAGRPSTQIPQGDGNVTGATAEIERAPPFKVDAEPTNRAPYRADSERLIVSVYNRIRAACVTQFLSARIPELAWRLHTRMPLSPLEFLALTSLVLAGVALGKQRPEWALAVFFAGIAVTSSTDVQLGGRNLATPHAYLLGTLLGMSWRSWRTGSENPVPGPLATRLAGATAAVVAVSAVLSLIEQHLFLHPAFVRNLVTIGDAGVYHIGGLAGQFQDGFSAVAGPLLLWLSWRVVAVRHAPTLAAGLICGGAIAVLTPIVQLLFLDPWVQPDLGTTGSSNLSGFFQDPHGYAAFLSVAITSCLGMGFGMLAVGNRWWALALFGLAGGAFVPLLFTHVRTGLAGAVLGTLMILILWVPLSAPEAQRPRRWRWAAAAAAAVVIIGLVLALAPGLRSRVQATLMLTGTHSKIWSFLDSTEGLLGNRPELWRAGLETVAYEPLWGVGPSGFERLDVPVWGATNNAHNYYLQTAVESGLPAAVLMSAAMLAAFFVTLRSVWNAGQATRGLLLGLGAAQMTLLIYSTLAHPLLLAELQGLYWGVVALSLLAIRRDRVLPNGMNCRRRASPGAGDVGRSQSTEGAQNRSE